MRYQCNLIDHKRNQGKNNKKYCSKNKCYDITAITTNKKGIWHFILACTFVVNGGNYKIRHSV